MLNCDCFIISLYVHMGIFCFYNSVLNYDSLSICIYVCVGRLAKNALVTGQVLVNGRNMKLSYGSAVSLEA